MISKFHRGYGSHRFRSVHGSSFNSRTKHLLDVSRNIQGKKIALQNRKIKQDNSDMSKEIAALVKENEALKNEIKGKDRFFSIVAHDLKGPFNGLLGFSRILADGHDDPEEAKQFAGTVHRAAENIYALLENLLSWARINNGSQNPVMARFNVSAAVEGMIGQNGLYSEQARLKGINLVSSIQPGTIAYVDTDMAKTILRNLISNAIKFTGSGHTVAVIAKCEEGVVEIRVKDTGEGMTEEQRSRLFRIDEKVVSADGTAGEKGTGMGLIIVKEMVEKNRGTISVESALGRGTTVTVRLPAEAPLQ